MKPGIYVGMRAGRPWEVFRSIETPTYETHGDRYPAAIGPFRTVRAATFMAIRGPGNPHCRCVADAERLSKRYPV